MRKLLICLLLLQGLNTTLSTTRAAEAAPKYQWQLIEKNHGAPLVAQEMALLLSVDGTRAQSQSAKTDENGMVDWSEFYRASAELLKKYPGRVQTTLYLYEKSIPLAPESWQATPQPQRLEIDLGPILVTGHFVNADGQRVVQPNQLYPADVRPYFNAQRLGAEQIRLYETDGTNNTTEIINFLRVDENGDFRLHLQPNRNYRFDGGNRVWTIANPDFTTGTQDQQLQIIAQPKSYILYGDLIDTMQQPVKESVGITGLSAYTNSSGTARYALCFDEPRTVELKIGYFIGKTLYREQKANIKIDQPLQRHNFVLELLANDVRTLKLRLKITDLDLDTPIELPPFMADNYLAGKPKAQAVVPMLSGDNYFVQRGQYIGDNTYEFTLPQAGTYTLRGESLFYTMQVPAALEVKENQTLEAKVTAKDTWLAVRVVDEAGQPVNFPPASWRTMHEPRTNSVALETIAPAQKNRYMYYLDTEPVGVGGALRPDENGELHFLLAKGGDYQLHTNFEKYVDETAPLQIETHQSKTVTLTLKRKP